MRFQKRKREREGERVSEVVIEIPEDTFNKGT